MVSPLQIPYVSYLEIEISHFSCYDSQNDFKKNKYCNIDLDKIQRLFGKCNRLTIFFHPIELLNTNVLGPAKGCAFTQLFAISI